MIIKKTTITILITLFITTKSFSAIEINNDNIYFKTDGDLESGFISKFNYDYNNHKIIGKTIINNDNGSYSIALNSLYTEKEIGNSVKVRIGRLPLINEIDNLNLERDLSNLSENKIKSYNGINLKLKKEILKHKVSFNNIIGFYEKNDNDYISYENVIGNSITLEDNNYKIRFGGSIIEPNIRDVADYKDFSKITLTSFEIDFKNKYFKHSNEFINKKYDDYNTKKSYNTRIDYITINELLNSNNLKVYSSYKIETDSLSNGYRKISNGIEYNPIEKLTLVGFYQNKTKFYNKRSNDTTNYLKIGLNFHY